MNSIDGYDEISLTGDFKVKTGSMEKQFSPSDLGFAAVGPQELEGGATVAEAKEIFDSILENRSSEAQKNVVLANSAFAISIVDPQNSLSDALALARESLESGRALQTLEKFIDINGK